MASTGAPAATCRSVNTVFVFVLLTRISGIPLLERKADRKWGGQEEYERYKANTPVLVPRLFG